MAEKGFIDCPECGSSVKRENLARHTRSSHSRQIDLEQAEGGGRGKHVFTAVALAMVLVLVGFLYLVVFRAPGGSLFPPTGGGGGDNNEGSLTYLVLHTDKGTIKVLLETEKAPKTTKNIIDLVKSGFYDGKRFYRVVKDFVIQVPGNDPDAGTDPRKVEWESTGLTNKAYTLAMARSGDANDPSSSGTGGTEFFISLKDNAALDNYQYPYVVFGRVVEGKGAVDAIGNGPVKPGSEIPLAPTVVTHAEIVTE